MLLKNIFNFTNEYQDPAKWSDHIFFREKYFYLDHTTMVLLFPFREDHHESRFMPDFFEEIAGHDIELRPLIGFHQISF